MQRTDRKTLTHEEIIAFYAWQSDTPQRFNRHLIRIALENAAERITASMLDVDLIVDYDTAGVPGQPPITDTILTKIGECDIFIPDVSFVARTSGGKLVPNPNVMTEYGYALRAKTYAAIMPVMNTVYGPPQDLPFDMGHLRHPIQYHLDPTVQPAQRRAVRRARSQQFKEKLRLQIAATEPPRPAPPLFVSAEPKDGPARFRAPGDSIGIGDDPFFVGDRNSISLATGPAMWLRLIPPLDPGKRWTSYDLKTVIGQGLALQPFLWGSLYGYGDLYTLRAEDGMGCCSLLSRDARETSSVAFAFETGEVWAIDTSLLGSYPDELYLVEIEKLFTQRLQEYAAFLTRLGLQPPYRWIAGLTGVRNRHLLLQVPPPEGQMRIPGWRGPECLSDKITASGRYDGSQPLPGALLPFFNEIYNKCGIPRPDYLPQ